MKSVIIRLDGELLIKVRRLKTGEYETTIPKHLEDRVATKIILEDNSQINLKMWVPKPKYQF